MKNTTTYITANPPEIHQPRHRKKTWKIKLIKAWLRTAQLVAPGYTAEAIWKFFTRPGRARFSESQQALMSQAQVGYMAYRHHRIVTYRWGSDGPKVLLCHGWNSKAADLRPMIETLTDAGYVVDAIDMKAHGRSEGSHSALPEFRDILKEYYLAHEPYQALIGYSLGGIAAGIVASELRPELQPEHLVIIAAPPYVRYFFEDIVKQNVGCGHTVYEKMCDLVMTHYHQPIDYFDLRTKQDQLQGIHMHLIYDEHDNTVPFERGAQLRQYFPDAHWVHCSGLGHYKIITHEDVIEYIARLVNVTELERV